MHRFLAASALAAFVILAPAVWAQSPSNPLPLSPPPGHALSADDANAWLDGFMPAALASGEIAGAVVVVVKDGQVLTERGFGVADVSTGEPVDPKRTGFRPGSISKLFTWTAVMQLVEQGKLNLDADINTYLDFNIPPRNGKPITLRNLLTHTAGFEEVNKHQADANPRDTSLAHEMKRWVPTRVFDPGTTPAYSNYGAALAGYIVERVSGEPFGKYVENHIFKPLDMPNSSIAVPMAKRIVDTMSKGYMAADKPALPFENIVRAPAGQMAGTGDDMAHFMIAHLQNGRYGDTQILKPQTARMMHDTLTSIMSPLHGMELGFVQQDINGHRVIGHGGDLCCHHSELVLFLDDNVGLFVSVNSSGVTRGASTHLRSMLFEGFADRYFPAANTDSTVDAKTAALHARMVSGSYIGARGSFDNFMALLGLIGQTKVIANTDGTVSFLLIPKPSGEPIHYREIAPFVWRAVGGHERFGAIVKDGKVVRVSSDTLSGFMVFDRAPWYRDASWIVPAAQLGAVVVILTAMGWPILAIIRKQYGQTLGLRGRRARAYRVVRVAASTAVAAMIVGFVMVSGLSAPGAFEALGNNDAALLLVEGLFLAGFVGGLLASLYNLFVIFAEQSSAFAKLWAVVVTLAFLALTWFAHLGGLLTFTTNY